MAGNGVMSIGAAPNFLNNPAFERNRLRQARLRSGVFGLLSTNFKEGEYSENSGTERGTDLSKSAAILRVEKTQGDTHNWTMEKVLRGAPTFGDSAPEKGGSLDFMNAKLVLHKTRAPAWQLPADMDLQRLSSVLDINHEQALREWHVKWHADAIAHETICAFLKGASDNVLSLPSVGGRGIDMGLGAGVQVSPMNIIVRGVGKVSGATLALREADLKTKIGMISNGNAQHLLTIQALQEISEELSTGSTLLDPVEIGGEGKFYCILPGVCRQMLIGAGVTGLGGGMIDYAKYTAAWGKDSPLLQMRPLEVGNLVIFFDNILSKYAPDVSGSSTVWGKATTNFQSWGYADLTAAQMVRGVGVIMGKRALLEATNKGIKYTTNEGPHETAREISSYVKRSMMRAQWTDPNDSGSLPVDQANLLFMFAYKGITHGL